MSFGSGSQLATIGDNAFYGTNINQCLTTPDAGGNVIIPASTTRVEPLAFLGCSSLTSVSFESGSQLATIGEFAFQSSGLSGSITLPASLCARA